MDCFICALRIKQASPTGRDATAAPTALDISSTDLSVNASVSQRFASVQRSVPDIVIIPVPSGSGLLASKFLVALSSPACSRLPGQPSLA